VTRQDQQRNAGTVRPADRPGDLGRVVTPAACGLGLGARLVERCLAFAQQAGYQRVVLWTNDVLTSARRIYQDAGFTLTDEKPHHRFGHDLVGQTWTLRFEDLS